MFLSRSKPLATRKTNTRHPICDLNSGNAHTKPAEPANESPWIGTPSHFAQAETESWLASRQKRSPLREHHDLRENPSARAASHSAEPEGTYHHPRDDAAVRRVPAAKANPALSAIPVSQEQGRSDGGAKEHQHCCTHISQNEEKQGKFVAKHSRKRQCAAARSEKGLASNFPKKHCDQHS